MIQVIHIVTDLSIAGGTRRWLLGALPEMPNPEISHTICFIGKINNATEGLNELRQMGHKVVPLEFRRRTFLSFLFRLYFLFRKGNFDVLHTHHDWNGGMETLVGFIAGIRVRILYFHTGNWQYRKTLLNACIVRINKLLGLLTANFFWAPSSDTLKRWLHNRYVSDSARFNALSSGIEFASGSIRSKGEIRRQMGIGANDWVLGNVGRMHSPKNLGSLVRAFQIVKQKVPEAILLLVGDGPEKAKIHNIAKELLVADSVVFAGIRNDIPEILSVMDIFVFPSIYESLGMAVLEAQDAGLPVLASDIPGLSTAIAPCWKKYFFPPRDIHIIAQRIMQARHEQRHRPSDFLEYFSAKNARNRLQNAYKNACAQSSRHRR